MSEQRAEKDPQPVGPTDDDLREAAEASLKRKKDFRVHLRVYVLVNLLLWAIWAVVFVANDVWFPWPLFPLLGWGIGLAFHWRATYRPPVGPSEAEVAREMERLRGG